MATNPFTTMETDPATGLPKQKKDQPYLNEGGTGYLPTVPAQPAMPNLPKPSAQTPANPTAEQVGQGNLNTIGTAQNAVTKALNPSQTLQNSEQMVLKQQADPNFGYDPASYNANALSNYDLQKAQGAKSFKQSNADIGGSGVVQENLLKTLMQNTSDRSNLENNLNQQAYETSKKNWADAITAGNTQAKAGSDIFSQGINNLTSVAGAGEGIANRLEQEKLSTLGFDQNTKLAAQQHGYDLEKLTATFGHDVVMAGINQGYDLEKMDRSFGNDMTKLVTASNLDTQSKSTLMELQDRIDTKQLLTQEDFTAVQNDLNRQAQIALQKGDQAGAQALESLRGQIAEKAQAAQNVFSHSERVGTQAWQTGERISDQDFQTAKNYYDWAQKNAEQANDIDAQKTIADMRAKTDLQMQTQGFGQQEKMAYIASQIEEAKANGDVGRQETLYSFQTTQDLEKMAAQGRLDEAKINLQGEISKALAEQDFTKATTLQMSQQIWEANQADKNRAIEETRTALEAKGADVKALFDGYESGAIDVNTVTSMLKGLASDLGVTVSPADPLGTEHQVVKEFNQTKLQFALSHPKLAAKDAAGNTILADTLEAQTAFNDFYNKSIYGEDSSTKGTSASNATAWNGVMRGNAKFTIAPPVEGSTFKMPNGSTYTRAAGNVEDYNGVQSFSAVDSATGETVQVIANHGVKYSEYPNVIFDPKITKEEADQIMANPSANSTEALKRGYASSNWGNDILINSTKKATV
jgi:hypothetical protein